MKEIVILTYAKEAADLYSGILERLLNDRVSISTYSLETDRVKEKIEADLLIISSYNLYDRIEEYVSNNAQIMIPNLTFQKSSFRHIMDLPAGTRAILVNATFEAALRSVEQIYQFGARHIELIPYSPYIKNINDISIAVTPGEEENVPEWIEQVINIGNRVIDISTIINILIHFNFEELFNTKRMKDYYQKIMPLNFSPHLNHKLNPFSINEFFMAHYEHGIIGFNPQGIIQNYNNVAEEILGYKKKSVMGENIFNFFPEPEIRKSVKTFFPLRKKHIRVRELDLLIDTNFGYVSENKICYLTFERINGTTAEKTNKRNPTLEHNHKAKYVFDDIITQNEELKKIKKNAEISTASDSSVLIIGETGTGKELFAQAIHNASNRKHQPFVAINCAAISENLLESELFGYDEGAFTGARRGGKKGLFEMADKGTLFLDEIAEMPVHLQARLLRVLQENEFIHIGGNQLIKTDIRFIAATNCDVSQLLDVRSFRKDLYYRLNVITINLPSLRERKEDIPILIEEFKKQMGVEFKIDALAMEEFQRHDWEGNVRELRNCVEYFKNLQKSIINIPDIPFLNKCQSRCNPVNGDRTDQLDIQKKEFGDCLPEAVFILEVLKEARECRKLLGRRSIAELSRQKYQYLSEMKIRMLFSKLKEVGFITILKGRGGTRITENGIQFLDITNSP